MWAVRVVAASGRFGLGSATARLPQASCRAVSRLRHFAKDGNRQRGARLSGAGVCPVCGSSVFSESGDEIEVHLGTLDEPTSSPQPTSCGPCDASVGSLISPGPRSTTATGTTAHLHQRREHLPLVPSPAHDAARRAEAFDLGAMHGGARWRRTDRGDAGRPVVPHQEVAYLPVVAVTVRARLRTAIARPEAPDPRAPAPRHKRCGVARGRGLPDLCADAG